MRTVVTAKDEIELKMRVDDLIERGFRMIRRLEPKNTYGSGYVNSYNNGNDKYSKKKIYVSGDSYSKIQVLMEN